MGEPSTSFNATKDIYALGTVLLEIGGESGRRGKARCGSDPAREDQAIPTR